MRDLWGYTPVQDDRSDFTQTRPLQDDISGALPPEGETSPGLSPSAFRSGFKKSYADFQRGQTDFQKRLNKFYPYFPLNAFNTFFSVVRGSAFRVRMNKE